MNRAFDFSGGVIMGMYDENDDNTAVFFFTDAVATISSFVEPSVVIKF